MNKKVLVAYATKHGATKEIAEKITAVVERSGVEVTLLPVHKVPTTLPPVDAVVLGSAIYMGRWRKEAVQFLQRHRQLLAQMRVWLFASGPTGEGDATDLLDGTIYPDAVASLITNIQPEDVLLVHGKLDLNELNIIERWMIRQVKAPLGDFRNWEQIEAWAALIGEQLQQELELRLQASED